MVGLHCRNSYFLNWDCFVITTLLFAGHSNDSKLYEHHQLLKPTIMHKMEVMNQPSPTKPDVSNLLLIAGWVGLILLAYAPLLLHPELHTACPENDTWNIPISLVRFVLPAGGTDTALEPPLRLWDTLAGHLADRDLLPGDPAFHLVRPFSLEFFGNISFISFIDRGLCILEAVQCQPLLGLFQRLHRPSQRLRL